MCPTIVPFGTWTTSSDGFNRSREHSLVLLPSTTPSMRCTRGLLLLVTKAVAKSTSHSPITCYSSRGLSVTSLFNFNNRAGLCLKDPGKGGSILIFPAWGSMMISTLKNPFKFANKFGNNSRIREVSWRLARD